MLVKLNQYKKVFKGKCVAVALEQRGKNDPHVCFIILHEDDGNWFISTNRTSCYWLPELIQLTVEAHSWLNEYCDRDPSGYGWQFRTKNNK